ncbi:DUF2652 domain-containing protein [Cochleicola gelatinilyticus]|uniref:Guanylate cyclase domain-containing protein n=1 Tax=Cochleicola gelatinilyticus TaxID=1763537 RepID=A0A167HIC3_9FLAO|nr:DUF2652 domain-containing protein [Cochleicola gelatinilyticus]OAB78639.1 hypothetical protein ULVI_08615 [Cochleicola gelatinilyticus]
MQKAEPTLICIPDISGFTRFMRDVDFKLSSEVIPALLNNIIYSNELNLKVSEIEGDAVLFYRTGDLPSLRELIDQCRSFYEEFYKQIKSLAEKHKHNKQSTDLPEMLGLKIILHFGNEIGKVQIGNRIKLMGEDVITAHRLLKNDINIDEYILISETLLSQYRANKVDENFDWATLHESSIEAEHLGELKFNYIDLSSLN